MSGGLEGGRPPSESLSGGLEGRRPPSESLSVNGFEEAVVAVVTSLEPGDVVTYGEVAAEAGYPGAARAVGNVLAHSEGLPWWRVVGAGGVIRTPHEERQASLLADDGVLVVGNRVVAIRPSR